MERLALCEDKLGQSTVSLFFRRALRACKCFQRIKEQVAEYSFEHGEGRVVR